MKRIFLLGILFLNFHFFAAELNYADPGNWIERNGRTTSGKTPEFDVFYIHPTLYSNRKDPFPDWNKNPPLRYRIDTFVKAQTRLFSSDAGIYAPRVRQLELYRCVNFLKSGVSDWWSIPDMRPGIRDTTRAFLYYLKHFNHGKPYILVGHSQGASDLYEMMKRCNDVSPHNGFVAAYLIGLPQITRDEVNRTFQSRGISAVKGEADIGVVIGWNTRSPGAKDSIFAVPGSLLINPLNWKTDSTPAGKELHLGAFRFDSHERNPSMQIKILDERFGTRNSLEDGALLVLLDKDGPLSRSGKLEKSVLHGNDIWFFVRNMAENMKVRVRAKKNGPPQKPANR